MSRHRASARRASTLALATLAALALSACGGTPAPSHSEPSPTVSSASPRPEPDLEAEVELFFAVEHPSDLDLVGERRTIIHDGDPVEAALRALLDESVAADDPDYANLWSGVELVALERAGDVLRLDLSTGLTGVGAEAETVAIGQLVWTATGIEPSIRALTFTIDGASPETIGGHVDARGEFERGLPESTLTPVQILSPAQGATIDSPLRATGVACVFEATFGWELLQGGTVLEEGFGMSAESCPARAPWSLDLGPRPAGEYTLVITEYSMKDGAVASTDSKTFTVSGR